MSSNAGEVGGSATQRPSAEGTLNGATRRAPSERPRPTHDSDALLQSLMDHAPFPMSLRDLEGRFQIINRLGAELMGRAQADIVGHTSAELFAVEPAAAIDKHEHEGRFNGT